MASSVAVSVVVVGALSRPFRCSGHAATSSRANALASTRGGKNISGASDRRELSMKTRQRDAVHEIRAVVGSIRAAALEGRGCIDHGDRE
jgi:hypothetical protein